MAVIQNTAYEGGGGGTAPTTPTNPGSQTPANPANPAMPPGMADFINSFIGMFPGNQAVGSMGNPAADKAAALKDIAIARRELQFQQRIGLRDIGQDRTMGLRKADNNALQRGIFDSGIRQGNRQLINREANEGVSDLKSQIGFALEKLANREANVKAGGSSGGSMGGGSGMPPGAMLDIISRFMSMGSELGWFMPPQPMPSPGGVHGGAGNQGPSGRTYWGGQ